MKGFPLTEPKGIKTSPVTRGVWVLETIFGTHFRPLTDHRWGWKLVAPITVLERGTLTVSIRDREGTLNRIEQRFCHPKSGPLRDSTFALLTAVGGGHFSFILDTESSSEPLIHNGPA